MQKKNGISSFGLAELLLGILFIGLGAYSFSKPSSTLVIITIFYGITIISSGLVDIVMYLKLERVTGYGSTASLVGGILNILLGILWLCNIGIGTIAISILFPLWLIVNCSTRLANLNFVKLFGGRLPFWVSLIVNVLGIILGFLFIFNPAATAVSLSYIVALYLIIMGVGSVIIAFTKLGQRIDENDNNNFPN